MSEIPAVSRRLLLGGAVATGALAAGVTAASPTASAASGQAPRRRPGQKSMIGVPFDAHRTVRVGVIGLGNRGSGMVTGWAAVPGCTVTAVCDIRAERAKRAADRLAGRGEPRPARVRRLRRLLRPDARARRHRPGVRRHAVGVPPRARQGGVARSGRHAVVELPVATELRQLWDLVDTSERTRKLLLAENCSYGRNELAMLRMAHAGLFGDVTNGHGGYLHDLRELLFSDTYYTDSWRRLWHTRSTVPLPHARAGPDRGGHGRQPRRPDDHAARHRDRPEGAGRLPRALRPGTTRPGRRRTSTVT
ncbi:Glycosyl hydrolase family 109 protein OS=Streptomyces griseomycini OX=66895 GN=FHS37_003734 PE=3 SV=1 [Streptomyces griseomycini]